jgi:hypothetical protein
MKQAICLPYCVDQNEPSKPLKQIISIPDNVVDRDKLLKSLFIEHVCEVDGDDIEVIDGNENDYGDVIVCYGDDMFVYVTFIEA